MPKDIFFGLKKLSIDLTVYGHFFIIRLSWSKMGEGAGSYFGLISGQGFRRHSAHPHTNFSGVAPTGHSPTTGQSVNKE